MFRHIPLKLRGPFRSQMRNQAGLCFSRFGKPGKNDQAITHNRRVANPYAAEKVCFNYREC
jgi:hypothetical protein